MKKFNVIITETLERVIEVEAFSEEAAENMVFKQYYNEEIILDSNDYVQTTFTVVE